MNAILQGLNTNVGILSFIVSIGVAWMVARTLAKSQVGDATNQAQNEAIKAMEEEIKSIRRKIEDLTKEKNKLEQTIDTICAALRIRGLVITIQGEIVHIEDRNGKTTTTRISKNEESNNETL